MTTTKQIRVMIVDDHAIVRDGLQLVLEQAGDMTVVGQAVDGEEALRVAREVEPDVVVMDLIMPNKDGVEACSEIMQTLPQTQVLVLTASTADDAIMNALAAGATGYLQKYSGRDDLLTAVRDAAAGRSQIPVDMVRRALESVREAPARGDDAPADVLTAREREVLRLFAEGNSYAQVAGVIGNSPITVRNTIYRIEQKLGVTTKQEIVVWAVRHGLLDEDVEQD
ncbi:MAG: response regulator transcription factor [Chloroflexi bacterium]|nr:response regulator transcription factor [Chloroflexota bacterium]MCY3589984.1 response regulator transcription factor [Chloroflexota bacterium]MCY3684695.1 response regulator transcription factor [Chloroflexota bacterium]MDE2708056.1 response regulator transcription factor [Chloroflexota bacterium]MDE2989134.1 response regulator transcription factor [Chloroflexota bacterium]